MRVWLSENIEQIFVVFKCLCPFLKFLDLTYKSTLLVHRRTFQMYLQNVTQSMSPVWPVCCVVNIFLHRSPPNLLLILRQIANLLLSIGCLQHLFPRKLHCVVKIIPSDHHLLLQLLEVTYYMAFVLVWSTSIAIDAIYKIYN